MNEQPSTVRQHHRISDFGVMVVTVLGIMIGILCLGDDPNTSYLKDAVGIAAFMISTLVLAASR